MQDCLISRKEFIQYNNHIEHKRHFAIFNHYFYISTFTNMIRLFLFSIVCFLATPSKAQNSIQDSATIKRISNTILSNYSCYNDLRDLCKNIGHRISGSPQAEQAVEWGKKTFEKMGVKVTLQEVMVPHWVRGKEEATLLVNNQKVPLLISSLGNAVGTGETGLFADMIMVNNMDEFKRLTEKDVKGKIVFFNHRFDQENVSTFTSYGPCVYYRWGAPSEASKLGAIAVIIRSVSSAFDNKPHTGSLKYDEKYPAIPAVAIGNTVADDIEKFFQQKKKIQLQLKTTCQMLPDVLSHNVVAEITGNVFPNEIICFGGHLDSWDIGEGAHDDGAGVVQAIDVLRTFVKLGIKPKRTIRAVLWMNEENGLRGGKKYAEIAKQKNETHICAIESDAGGAAPYGFSMSGTAEQRAKVKAWRSLFLPYNVHSFDGEGGGADIGPLRKEFGTPVMELLPESQRYFDYHHSANDVFENVHRRELCLGAVAMTSMVYLLSQYGL
jgi:hypothetical protein